MEVVVNWRVGKHDGYKFSVVMYFKGKNIKGNEVKLSTSSIDVQKLISAFLQATTGNNQDIFSIFLKILGFDPAHQSS